MLRAKGMDNKSYISPKDNQLNYHYSLLQYYLGHNKTVTIGIQKSVKPADYTWSKYLFFGWGEVFYVNKYRH